LKRFVFYFFCIALILSFITACLPEKPLNAAEHLELDEGYLSELENEQALIEQTHIHEWIEADCNVAMTCSECGETEGSPAEHIWQDADCSAPMTCSVCGETEGILAEHIWRDANFQELQTCTECGETEGELLTPGFIAHGFDTNAEMWKAYPYVTTNSRNNRTTKGEATVTGYRVFESDDERGRPAKEGYEWHVVSFEKVFSDRNFNINGYVFSFALIDPFGFDPNAEYDDIDWGNLPNSEYDGFKITGPPVNFHGVDYEIHDSIRIAVISSPI